MGRKPASKKKKNRKLNIRLPKIKKRQGIAIFILLFLVIVSAGILLYLEDKKPAPPSSLPLEQEKTLIPHLKPKKEPEKKEKDIEKPLRRVEPIGKGVYHSKVAIVIDDLGSSREAFNKLINIGIPFSFAVLPHQDYTLYISKEARKRKYDLLLHLPMEPEDKEKAYGEGLIVSGMTPNEMLRLLEEDLKSVPNAIGVNNHMGSLLTQDKKAMAILLGEIKRRGLFFVDSRTTSKTVAYEVAKKLGLKAAERNVFLDDIEDEEQVIKQIEILINTAKRNGAAIGIGHPRPATIAALEKMKNALMADGIEVVPVSRLVN